MEDEEDSVTVAAGLLPGAAAPAEEDEGPSGDDMDPSSVIAGSFLDAVKANDKAAVAAIFRLLMEE